MSAGGFAVFGLGHRYEEKFRESKIDFTLADSPMATSKNSASLSANGRRLLASTAALAHGNH